jgi:glucose-1-phosphate thymidylyltransferase
VKALVLAGGSGTRLRPFSYSMPKQLIPVANTPVLLHCLKALQEADIEQVGMIVGSNGDEIRAVVGDGAKLGLEITYLTQDRPLGLAHCVTIARDFLGDDDFVMFLGGNLLVGGIQELTEQFRAERPTAQIVVTPVEDPREHGVAEVDGHGNVIRLVEKPLEPHSELAMIGVYFFTPEIHDAVASIQPSWRNEYEITDAVDLLVQRGRKVTARLFGGYWKDTGCIQDVLECNQVLLEKLTPRLDGDVDAYSELSGPVVVEPGARIIRSRIIGPAIIAAGSVIENSYVGPYTSLGRDCRLELAGVECSIVLDGARLDHVRGIRDSIIGRNAEVRTTGTRAQHRLVVGDHSLMELMA